MLRRWGHFAATHHWWVIGTWVVLVPALWVLGLAVGGEPDNTFTLPGSPSQDAQDRLEADFPAAAGASATVVYHSRTGADLTTDTSVQQEIEASLADISGLDGVASVTGPVRNDDLFSEDGSTALASVVWADPPDELPNNGVDAFEDLDASVAQHRSDDLQLELGGTLPGAQPTDVEPALVVYGLVAALVILAVALATWWSFAWPVVGALAGVGLGVSLVRFLELAVDVPTISETAAVMIGLGVGIDYGLFVVGRAKDHVEAGEAPVAAAGRALDTVGRAVLTAGATVVVALGALLVFDVPAVTAMAYAVVVVVPAVVPAALTLPPAIIGAGGPRLARGRRCPRRGRARRAHPPAGGPRRGRPPPGPGPGALAPPRRPRPPEAHAPLGRPRHPGGAGRAGRGAGRAARAGHPGVPGRPAA